MVPTKNMLHMATCFECGGAATSVFQVTPVHSAAVLLCDSCLAKARAPTADEQWRTECTVLTLVFREGPNRNDGRASEAHPEDC
jgi:hypothetical protein